MVLIDTNAEEAKTPIRHEAIFRLNKYDYPELERAVIVITDEADKVCIAVKAVGRVCEKNDIGFNVHEEQFGDYCFVNKNEPISKFFDSLQDTYKQVSRLIDEANKDVEA